jgi:hypothetical protein
MSNVKSAANTSALDPRSRIVYGREIDQDLGITDRGRRKLIARGVLPPPQGYFGGRAFWLAAQYEAFKAEVLAGKYGKPHRPGTPAQDEDLL